MRQTKSLAGTSNFTESSIFAHGWNLASANFVPQGTQVAVIWVGINDVRRGASRAQVRANVDGIMSRLRSRGIESYVIRPPVYDVSDHKNSALTVPDGHFNAAGYRKMVGKTLRQVQTMVVRAAKKRKAA